MGLGRPAVLRRVDGGGLSSKSKIGKNLGRRGGGERLGSQVVGSRKRSWRTCTRQGKVLSACGGGAKNHKRVQESRSRSPSPKGLPTTRPAAGKGLFLGMSSLMSLDMFHASNMGGQCKPIYDIEDPDGVGFDSH